MSSETDTKGRILDAALTCALESGGLTMAEVAAVASLSRQAVYLHFPDRAALLAGLAARLAPADGLAAIAAAPSARAALAAMVADLAADYPRLRPVARLLDGAQTSWQEARLAACRRIAQRFRDEGALSRHLSLDAASDLLWSLTGLALWDELITGRGWTADRYRSHLAYLAISALTK